MAAKRLSRPLSFGLRKQISLLFFAYHEIARHPPDRRLPRNPRIHRMFFSPQAVCEESLPDDDKKMCGQQSLLLRVLVCGLPKENGHPLAVAILIPKIPSRPVTAPSPKTRAEGRWMDCSATEYPCKTALITGKAEVAEQYF